METHFTEKRILAVGLGLIGGSAAKALRAAGCRRIDGLDTDEQTVSGALRDGVIDAAFSPDAPPYDLVLCSLPHRAVPAIYQQIKTSLAQGGVFAELSGLKSWLIKRLCAAMYDEHVLLCLHPMAGSEKKGYANADADLLGGAPLILTPTERTNETALLWAGFIRQAFGSSEMITLCARRHDQTVAAVSHLPHVAALALCEAGKGSERYAGGSFAAVTRVAAINAPLWAGLLHDNAEYLLESLARYRVSLESIEAAVRAGDKAALEALLKRLSKEE